MDELYMQRCIDLARLGGVEVAPNPMVGAVIVYNNTIIGEGYHQKFGESHAEVNAIQAVKNPELLAHSTIYVSLEPCAHSGKTPPCANLLIEKGFRKVVIGCQDSYHEVSGKGIALLRNAGIEVVVGVLEEACKALNKRFFTFHRQNRPYVILKWAQTKDGFIDTIRTDSEPAIHWISAPETQALVHQWRSQEQAILVGWKTIENDNPSLTVREVKGSNPLRVVIDGHLQIPENSTIFRDQEKTLVLNRIKNEKIGNVEWVKIPVIDTQHILEALHARSICSVFIEGGSRTLQHFLVDNLWDEARIIVGAHSFGDGVKAPRISEIPANSYAFSTDTIYQYYRK
jgi:diaminohydroxyphosphoribosylaminopyrimidine deaminase/5-amino-6-(5-phosphoribosylamino)uracil reductase